MFIKYINKTWPLYPYKSKYLIEFTREQFQLLANVVESTGSFKAAEVFFPGYTGHKLEYVYYFLICGYRKGAKPTQLLYPKLTETELRLIDEQYCRSGKPRPWKEIGAQFPRFELHNIKYQYFRWKKVKPDPKPKLKNILSKQERETLIERYRELKCWKQLAEFYPDFSVEQIKYYYRTQVLGYHPDNLPKREDEYWTPERRELFQKLWTSERNLSKVRKAFHKSPAKLYAQAEKMGIERLSALN